MEIQVQAIRFEADKELIQFVQQRVSKLTQFFENIIDLEVYLKIDKAESHNNKVVEIKLNVPGKDLFAKKQCKSFEHATDDAIEALRRQLKKHKGKIF
jgi:putative sigma-54 modulation protein